MFIEIHNVPHTPSSRLALEAETTHEIAPKACRLVLFGDTALLLLLHEHLLLSLLLQHELLLLLLLRGKLHTRTLPWVASRASLSLLQRHGARPHLRVVRRKGDHLVVVVVRLLLVLLLRKVVQRMLLMLELLRSLGTRELGRKPRPLRIVLLLRRWLLLPLGLRLLGGNAGPLGS